MMDIIRFITPVLEPFILGLALIVAGTGFLIFKKSRRALACLACGIAVLLFFGYGIGTKSALYRLERAYAPLAVEGIPPDVRQRIRYVVVLGSGHVSDPDLPRTAQIGGSSLYRLVEGIRIYRLLPGSRLVLSGGLTLDPVTNARIVGDVARQIGIPARDAIVEERPRDTLEEAKVLRGLLGSEPFVLVTSAAHMKRAVGIFKDLGMLPLPAPTDFILKNGPAGSAETWLPNCGNISISQRVIYEWLGEAWRWIRGIARL
jgi:uncharacterized SAM-binding protein YcdF (DUF218 family)